MFSSLFLTAVLAAGADPVIDPVVLQTFKAREAARQVTQAGLDPAVVAAFSRHANKLPEPSVEAPATKTITQRVLLQDPNSHLHKCDRCGTEWTHSNSSRGNTAAHTCPNCPAQDWSPNRSGVRFENRQVTVPVEPRANKTVAVSTTAPIKLTYEELVKKVKEEKDVLVSAGLVVHSKAKYSVDEIPGESFGLWRCFVASNGELMMERVTEKAPTQSQPIGPTAYYSPSNLMYRTTYST